MHARKSIFHTHFGAEEEHQNKRITYPILRDKMSRMKARTQPVAHTKRKAQPPDRCCETGRRWCLPVGLTLRPKGRTVTISQHQPACAGLPLHLRVQLLVLPDAEPHLPRWLLQPPKTMVASGRTNSAFVPIAGLMQRVSHFCLNPDRLKRGEPNQGVPKRIT